MAGSARSLARVGLGLAVEVVQGTDGSGDYPRGHRGVAGGGVDPAMSEQRLDDADIRAVFQQVRGEGVAPIPAPE